MGSFYHVRGWLETSFEMVPQFKEIVEKFSCDYIKYHLVEDQAVLYQKGWYFPEHPINYINYIFYGAEVKNEDYIKDQIIEMVELCNDEIDGLFYFDYEGDYPMMWRIFDGKVIEENRDI
jgi:hypothetical protein